MMTLIAHEKNDIIASETNHENDRYSILKFQIFSVINLFDPKKTIETQRVFGQLMKTNTSNLEKL